MNNKILLKTLHQIQSCSYYEKMKKLPHPVSPQKEDVIDYLCGTGYTNMVKINVVNDYFVYLTDRGYKKYLKLIEWFIQTNKSPFVYIFEDDIDWKMDYRTNVEVAKLKWDYFYERGLDVPVFFKDDKSSITVFRNYDDLNEPYIYSNEVV